MVLPPLSICDLIKTVDLTIRICKSVKSAPEEVQSLSERLEFSSKILEEIKVNLVKSTDYRVGLLDEACTEYQTTLKNLGSYLGGYKTLKDSPKGLSWRDRTKWVAKEERNLKYLELINDHEKRIALLLQV